MNGMKLLGLNCGALILVSGCAGVPRLYDRAPEGAILAPKVEDIVRQIACELGHASRTQMKGRDYVITALLNLQVIDTLHVTPSLSFISPLSAPNTNFTLGESLDVGGERKRSFTTTLVLHSAEFQKENGNLPAYSDKDPQKSINKSPCAGDKLYSLAGNLGLSEIVRDGLGSYLIRYGDANVHADDTQVKALFGSTIEFAVNRTVSALGPVWTLTSFKGPGGSGGLLNGKSLGTDTLTITFSLVSNHPEALAAALQRVRDLEAARTRSLEAVENSAIVNVAAQEKAVSAKRTLRRLQEFGVRPNKSAAVELEEANRTIDDADAAQRNLDNARAERDRATRELENARMEAARATEQKGKAVENAATAGQTLLNYMILQNLNVTPR